MNVQKLAWLATAALAAPLAANAASVTYDFTGTVTSSSGIFSGTAVGTTVSGTYTINYGNATTTTGTVGSSSFMSSETTGSSVGLTPSSAYVFSDTVSGGTFSYSTGSPGAYTSTSSATGSNGSDTFKGAEEQDSASCGSGCNVGVSSNFTLSNTSSAAYDSSGLPLSFTSAPAGSADTGSVFSFNSSSFSALNYSITSLTQVGAVPLPAAAWLMLSGLGGLVGIARRKQQR